MSTLRMFKGGNVRSVVARNARNLKLCLSVAFAALLAANANAQCPPLSSDITQYTFSTGVGTASNWLTPATNNTLYSGYTDDGVTSVTNLGFTFTFEGTAYTQFSANSNGRLKLGSTAVSNQWGAPFNSSHYTVNNPQIIGIGADLSTGTAGYIKYGVSGTSPNRIGVVTFRLNNNSGNSTNYLNWQIQLYEATGEIRIVYDSYVSISNSFEIGVQGANYNDIVTVNPSTHTQTVNNTYTSTTYSTWPGQYRYYSFMPPVLSCPPVYNLVSNSTTSTISWTECGTATQWLVEYGSVGFTPGSGTQVLVNTNSYNYSSLAGGIYSFYVRPYCSVGDTGTAQSITVAHNFTFCGGAGTQANPYLICNETDLRNLSTCVNAGVSYPNTYFRLVNNIAMSQGAFTPIGSPSTPFRGHFDGNNRSITNLSMTNTTGNHNGLFGMLIGGSIKNLTVGGTVAGGDTTGAIVGSAVSSTISGCTNNASVTGSYYAHGGIAGSIVNTKVLNCRNTGGVAGSYCTGGIVGYANTRSAIHRCSNSGTISNYSQYHGGIAGYFYNTAVNGDTVGIFACRNTGSVTGGSYTGGVVGYVYYSNVDSCSNTISLTTSGYSYVGGVVGYAYYTKIRRCSNRGNIPGSGYVGGICGRLYGSSTAYGYLQYCVNTGHISATSTNIGGIVGYTGYSYIDYNTNSGDVITTSTSASSYVGGIAGYGTTSAYVRYNLNGGYIKSSGGYVGGICGYSYGSTYVTYNLNVNDVKGGPNTAAIAGSGAVATTNFWDKQMCPTTFLYGTTANATCAKTTAQLVGVATYPSTSYFTATANLYPIPSGMRDSLGSKLAATPIFLTNSEDVGDVKHNFTVGTTNSVSWTSSVPSVISISGANATVAGFGSTQLTGTTSGMQKHIWIYNIPTFCGGSGTQADPYLICTANTLDTLAQCVNGGMDFNDIYFKVVNDLDLSSFSNWRVIGESGAYPFKGHFDGNNKTISNLKITGSTQYRGLFGNVVGSSSTSRADIHNLTVKGSVSGGQYTGGIVGYCDNVKLYNIVNEVDVSSTSNYCGGIAGYNNSYSRFDSCENKGTINGYYYAGGIVGYQNSYDTITNCRNTKDVKANYYYVGGIVGSKSSSGYIQDCENIAKITVTYTSSYNYAGGIAGYMGSSQFIKNCNNSGDVVAGSYYVGGIVGYYSSGQSSLTGIYEIRNCHNSGNISGTYYMGGIVGYGNYCRIRFCDNRGNINSTSYAVGGIAGYMYYYCLISGCNNYGDVTTSYTGTSWTSTPYGTGGIVGCSNYGTSISGTTTYVLDSCNNYGDVTSSAYLTGGIIGQLYYYAGSVRKCHNYGKVTGTYYVGGVSGFHRGAYSSTASYAPFLISCSNAGEVSGTNNVGGVVGRNGYTSYGYNAKVQECVNVGRVKGTQYVGGICGYNYGYSSTSYRAIVMGCLNAGIVEASNYAGGVCGYTYTSTYAIQQYNLNVANVLCTGTYQGAVDGYSYAPTSCYFDSLMCPAQYYYYNTAATATTGKRTSALTDGTFNPSATYFTATRGLYPRPTAIANHPITLLAATPVFLDETNPTNHVNNVNTCYTVGIANSVSWTSSDPTQTAIIGANGSILAVGTPTITAHKDSLIKEVDIDIVSMPTFGTFTYPAISDTIGRQISGVRPSLTSGCTFFSNNLPDGLSINASTGEISGAVYDTLHTTFTVIASCNGCAMSQATVRIDIVPAIICAGYTVTLPAGKTWYYDKGFTQPVTGPVVVDSNTTFYARGASGVSVNDFSFTGSEQVYTAPLSTDSLRLQVWGAEGGAGTGGSTTLYAGGKGGYSEGTLSDAIAGQTLYVYVGGKGMDSRAVTTTNQPYPGGWNGGGDAGVKTYSSSYYQGGSGGGGTDIRIAGNTLYSRVIVAGGGGGTGYTSSYGGGYGGGDDGGDNNGTHSGQGGSQTSGGIGSTSGSNAYGASASSGVNGQAGDFGLGGHGGQGTNCSGGAGGGGGWYGGGGGKSGSSTSEGGAGGGSGYVYTSATAGDYPSGCLLNSNYYLDNARTIDGANSFESIDGSSETGHEGDGHARITTYYTERMYYMVNTLPLVSGVISGNDSICNGGSATLTLRFTGGAPYRYRITGDATDRTANSDQVTIQVSPTTSTLYHVTYVQSTVTGCEAVPAELLGLGIVEVCGSDVICAGDSLALPAGYTWYTDANRTNQVNGKVAPTTNTTYYRQGASYNVVVVPRGTATILDTVYNICSDSTAEIIINFTGVPPFRYRLTGDNTDRTTVNYYERVSVYTDTSAIFKVTYFADQNPRCSGVIKHSNAQVILCDQPIICFGDTVWLPEGQWYYDYYLTRPVTTPYVIPDITSVYYQEVLDTFDFEYTGHEQVYQVPQDVHSLNLQVWGAQGGTYNPSYAIGGKGGYSEGILRNVAGRTLYVYVGGEGSHSTVSTYTAVSGGGFNGGGDAGYNGGTGGGGTDIRIAGNTLYSRVIVAGGGGGAYSYSTTYKANGGDAGGLAGENGSYYSSSYSAYTGKGATQIAGGAAGTGSYNGHPGTFGQGGNSPQKYNSTSYYSNGAGGGGWYGGGSAANYSSASRMYSAGGGGGSGYVYTASTASNYPSGCLLNSNYYLDSARTVAGNVAFPSPEGASETGHEGDGFARITTHSLREFTVLVLDNTEAAMADSVIDICNGQSATLHINFSGTAPFTYRITGDSTDRTSTTNRATVSVSPTVTTNYQVTYVQGDICEGNPSATYTTVRVCNQPIICAGDTAYLPAGTWYTDANLTQAVADTFVTPTVTTTYYGANNATFVVTVNPITTANLIERTYSICDSSVMIRADFSGTLPFYYRITGDTADRVSYSNITYIPVSPDTTTQYHITAFSDSYCQGSYDNNIATVEICNQPIICKGDTVWLDTLLTWFYDSTMLDTIRTQFVVPTQTTVYYNNGGNGSDTLNFRYTGSVQTYTIPRGVDSVFMQVWGAEGGGLVNSGYTWFGGKGGYSQGKMAVRSGDVLSIYVGGRGRDGATGTGSATGGFNGGGSSANCTGTSTSLFHGGAGGGATDIRVNSTALNARAIVAGGGGGAGYGQTTSNTVAGGNGGGISGDDGICQTAGRSGYGATATAGGAGGVNSGQSAGVAGSLGVGAASAANGSYSTGGGGGGGWYGGGSGAGGNGWAGSGGGGSGFVYVTSNANCQLPATYYLTTASTIAADMPFPDTTCSGSVETGHEDNGYARIITIGPAISTLRVTVKPSYSDTIRQTICAGASFVHNDSVYTVQGTYYQYFESYDHCDSIEVIELTVNDTLRDTMRVEICAGITLDTNGHLGCVPVNGQQYAPYWIQGVYTQYLRDTVTGCFQNFVIDLTVSDTIRDTVWHTICPSGHYIHNNITYRDTGTFRQALKTPQGCDSILAIVIDRSDTLRETIYRNMCKGSFFPLNGYTYYDTGTYKQPLTNLDGCDSILTLVLTYSDTLRDTIHPIICAGDTFVHNGIKYYQTGMSNQYFVSRFQCDSLIYIDLTVRDTIFEHVYDTICAGASVTYNGETFTQPGEYHQILQAAVHCDSFLTIHVHVNDTIRDTIYDTVCAGQTITVNNQTYWIEGEYKQWLRDAGTDCFHNYVIYLEVNDTIRDTIEPWICAGQVFNWNRVPYSVAGWYRQEFRTQEGCDSILHIHLIVGDTLRDTVYYSVCSGHNITVNGITYDSTGWYRQNLKNFDDCDSILHIHLTIEDTLRGHVFDTICYGDTYNFNGSDYYIPGIYPYVTRTLEGCDSIAYLHLHVNDTIITHVYDTICRDAQYYYLDTAYDQTGEYYHLLHRTTGCDSTVVLHLFERDSIQSVHYDTICNNTTFRYYGQLLARTGRYPYRHTSVLTGCDSVEWLALTVLDYPVLSIIDSGSYCEGGHATLKANTTGNYITWTSSPYDPTMNGQDHNFTIYVSPDRYTEYTATVDIRPYNCRSTDVHAVNKPAKVEARMSMSPEEITAENLQCSFTDVSIGTIMYREWLFHERIPTIPDKQFFGERTVNYTSSIENDTLEVRLIVVNDEGCYDTATNLYPVFRGDVWVPNAFTPGRIGANHLLKVGHYNLIEYEIFIYTREGLLVFHSDDPEISWDGTYNYKDCKSGSYVYVVHYRTKSRPSESYEKKGSVLLIR